MTNKPNCYKCLHRRDLLGDCHSRCAHPALMDVMSDPLAQVLTLLGGVSRTYPIEVKIPGITATGNTHGIRNGWFTWPFNFDPTWLETCDGWEEK